MAAIANSAALTGGRPSNAARFAAASDWADLSARMIDDAISRGHKSAVFCLEVDAYSDLGNRYGSAALAKMRKQIVARIAATLRDGDLVVAVDDARFRVCLKGQSLLDLETCLELAGRLQRSLEDPFVIESTEIFASFSVGFCQLGRERPDTPHERPAISLTKCADLALAAAVKVAPSGIRDYSRDMRKAGNTKAIAKERCAVDALQAGEIVPYFQPQISTDTGQLTGFEALARWVRPGGVILAPGEFMSQLERDGAMERLAEVMLFNSLTALRAWDQAGASVPQVGLNFSGAELRDPGLADRIAWELDRFGLTPDRLCVEILETVVAHSPDDTITRNINRLADMGCQIDLDDFGTGHASIASLRKFNIQRIKIDHA